jgi:hypothetical protein
MIRYIAATFAFTFVCLGLVYTYSNLDSKYRQKEQELTQCIDTLSNVKTDESFNADLAACTALVAEYDTTLKQCVYVMRALNAENKRLKGE